jgi:cellulose synthase/poly-beta-1,6-N-acetylglucosamine synthase-like glycosyltransferase
MTRRTSARTSGRHDVVFVTIVVAILLSFGLLYYLIPLEVLLVCGIVGVLGGVVSLVPALLARSHRSSRLVRIGPLAIALAVVVPFCFVLWYVYVRFDVVSPTTALMVSALSLVFYYYALMLPLAYLDVLSGETMPPLTEPYPTVSVVIPAYNEEECIGASLEALERIDYPQDRWEVVVVDDGSTDRTAAIATEHAGPGVRVFTKQNEGKHSALNYGVERATGEVIVTVDADSLLAADTLHQVAATFQARPDVDAVAGVLTVANRGRFITELQELEYVIGIYLFRRAYNFVEAVTLVPGALGAYRRSALERVGGFDGDTLTEDFDATVKLLKLGAATRTVDAVCLTEAPETWHDLYKQRLRWDRGHAMTLSKHADVFRSPRFGFLYAIAFPIVLLSMTVVPIAGMVILVSIFVELAFGSIQRVAAFAAFFMLLQGLVSVLALRLGDNDPTLAVYAPLFVIGYRQFLDIVRIKSVLDIVLHRNVRWTRPARAGTLHEALPTESDRRRVAVDSASDGREADSPRETPGVRPPVTPEASSLATDDSNA